MDPKALQLQIEYLEAQAADTYAFLNKLYEEIYRLKIQVKK